MTRMNREAPLISIDTVPGGYILMATNYGRTAPAGDRLLRSKPYPDVIWNHSTLESAERDRDLLQKYCDAAWAGKLSKKTRGREEADVMPKQGPDLSDAVWK